MGLHDTSWDNFVQEGKEKVEDHLKEDNQRMARENWTRDDFFIDDKFVPVRLSNHILNCLNVKTTIDDDTLWAYNGGTYEKAEKTITSICKDRLGESFSIRRIKETLAAIKADTYWVRKESPKNLLCVNNGVLDLEDGLKRNYLMEHSPRWFFIQKSPINFNREAECPLFLEFLNQVVAKNDIPVVQEMFGYCLWRKQPYQKAFMMLGQGSNGKSTLLGVLKELLGPENVSSISLQQLATQRFAAAALYGKLANIYPDLSSKSIKDTGLFKILTGGDAITAEQKFKHSFLFTNYAKLIFSANKLPEVSDDTDAFHRRWIFVNFPNTFEGNGKDSSLQEKLSRKEEMEGVLTWSLEGLYRLQDKNGFSRSLSTEEAREFYIKASSPVQAFVMDKLEVDVESFVTKVAVYEAFRVYCIKNSLPTVSYDGFARKLREHINFSDDRKIINAQRVRGWKGIRIRE